MTSPVAPAEAGLEMYELIRELYPICRSITGDGVRETLRWVSKHIPLVVHEVPTGTPVFDWTVPREWNIRNAYVMGPKGDRIIDFKQSNLHVLNYSVPVKQKVSLAELKEHLFSVPEHPDWIPYRTSYYKENWGFCVTQRQLEALEDGLYGVCIDSTLENGHLTYGEYYLSGETANEVLITCHVCHPSLANDNLSGIAVVTFLAKQLSVSNPRHSYRFLFIPGTIGSITWLARNDANIHRIKHGLTVACVGDEGKFTYKRSRKRDSEIDRVVSHVLQHSGKEYEILDFTPYGYDERQFCSPGFNLPVGCFMRTPHGRYPEYHTSADNLAFVHPASLEESLATAKAIIEVLEGNRIYMNQNPKCEPQLGKRGLYRSTGGPDAAQDELAILWVLNLSDGDHSLLNIAERSGLAFQVVQRAAHALAEQHLLLERAP